MLNDDHNQQDERLRVREIPVIHENPRMAQHQYQHQRAMPQTEFGFIPMSQPQLFSSYQSAPHQQTVNRQKAASPQQPSAKLPKTSQQTKMAPKERIVPIQVVHQHESQSSVSKSPSPTFKPKQTKEEVKETSRRIEMDSPEFPQKTESTNKKPSLTLSKKKSTPKKDETTDAGEDHRVVEARKKLNSILENLESLENEVIAFCGSPDDKLYKKLEEQLMAKLLRLDEVNANGSPKEELIRSERKNTVKRIQQTLDLLELKGTS